MFKMKKYQRLLLIIVSITSLALFLVYRHHYNRLRHVLEVFNFFGTPCNITELQRSDWLLLEHDWGPQPLWKELDNKRFVYSAFLVEKNTVRGIGVRQARFVLPKTCFLLFEDDNKPLKGKLTTLKLVADKSEDFEVYTFSCTFRDNGKHPYTIFFKSQTGTNYVSTLITDTLEKQASFNSTICVFPSNFSKKSLLEFLSFHNLLGVESFIVYYEENIPYRVIKLLKNLSNTLNMWINFFPYTLPLGLPNDFTHTVLEYDCQLRTSNQAKYSLSLGINDYIVPYLDNKKPADTRLPIKKFCLNHINTNSPMVLQNFELVDDYRFNDIKKVNKNNVGKVLGKLPSLFETNCALYKYEKCEKGIKTKTDFSMKRFSTDLTRSTLVQMLIRDGF